MAFTWTVLVLALALTGIVDKTFAWIAPRSLHQMLGLPICRSSYRHKSTPLSRSLVLSGNLCGQPGSRGNHYLESGARATSLAALEMSAPIRNTFYGLFLPGGNPPPDYYRYAIWRAIQRLVSATNGVFGSQALIMALGIRKKHIGIAAASIWVLKDGLGKVARILWAVLHGGKFDGDPKKWRFLASLLFVAGGALEIVTYLAPSTFMFTAALANAMKQMAMVTSSATRSTIYKSFSRDTDNIGDITAKGEAQIAVIDLLGLVMGVLMSRVTHLSRAKVATMFALLSVVDLYCVRREIQSVVFRNLNFERTHHVLQRLFSQWGAFNSSSSSGTALSSVPLDLESISPTAVARCERLLLPAPLSEGMVRTWDTLSARDPAFVRDSTQLFSDEAFAVVLHARPVCSVLDALLVSSGLQRGQLFLTGHNSSALAGPVPVVLQPEVLVRGNASSLEVFRAAVVANHAMHAVRVTPMGLVPASVAEATAALRHVPVECGREERRLRWQRWRHRIGIGVRQLAGLSAGHSDPGRHDGREHFSPFEAASQGVGPSIETERLLQSAGVGSHHLLEIIRISRDFEQSCLKNIVSALQEAGWEMNKFSFGSVSRRVVW